MHIQSVIFRETQFYLVSAMAAEKRNSSSIEYLGKYPHMLMKKTDFLPARVKFTVASKNEINCYEKDNFIPIQIIQTWLGIEENFGYNLIFLPSNLKNFTASVIKEKSLVLIIWR